ncbi:unnamed protein product [Arctogadus glacialis]
MASYTVTLNGPAPWGFRLQGGKDFNMPLCISRITPSSKAAGGTLSQGDIISAIDGHSTEGMTHLEAQNKIKTASSTLALTMQKSRRPALISTGTPRMESPMPIIPHQKEMEEDVKMEDSESSGSCLAKSPTRRILFQSPEKEPGPFRPFVATAKSTASPASSAASPPGQRGQYNCPIGLYSAHNLREMALMQCKLGEAEPAAGGQLCLPGFNPIALKDSALSTHKPIEVRGPGGKATIVHAQYNTPISMYSQDAIMDAIAGQSQAKGHEGEEAGSPLSGALPVKDPVIDCASPVYQAVIRPNGRSEDMADWAYGATNLQSKSFRMLAHLTGTEYMQDPDEEALLRSREKFEHEVKGPRFAKLKNWHNGLSAQILNIH